jgi:FAD/FMN-containing dehydrogenase
VGRGCAAALRRREDAAYVNFVGDEVVERVRAAYRGETWDRLAEVKRRYDPENVLPYHRGVRLEKRVQFERSGVASAGVE